MPLRSRTSAALPEQRTDDALPPVRPAAARAEALVKTYGSGDTAVTALRGVDVVFPAGEFAAIMGPSGSGKSTLMHCLAGLDSATSGRLWIGDTELTSLDDKKLTRLRRDAVGFVFQAFNLLPTLTAAENILLPLDIAGRKVDTAWYDEVVAAVGLGDRLTHRPSELSGGQQQRVACARALVTKPSVIFADEPTGNLDSRSGAEVLGFLRQTVDALGQTVVMVTHDASAASYADRVLFLADGDIVDEMRAPTAERVLDRMKSLDGVRGGLTVRTATLKNLLAHKLRMALTALSVVLGVAFVSGTLVLTDTMGSTFDTLFGEANENTDVAVRAEASFAAGDGSDDRETVPLGLVDEVAAVEGVAEAVPYVEGFAQVVGSDGDVVSNGMAPTLGVSWIASEALSPLRTDAGRGPRGPAEVALDVDTADKGGVQVGDRVRVLLQGPAREVQVVGIFTFGEANALAGATMVAFDERTAQEVLTAPGQISRVVVRADDGVAQEELAARVQAAVPQGVEAITGEALAEETADSIQSALSFFSYFLLTFAVIAVFVGSFIIFNTFSMLVAQRTRELGLLRALGASRGQVTRSVLLEALVVGLFGSVVGLASGFGVAVLLQKIMNATGAGLPEGDLVFQPSTAAWAFAVGVGVTTVAAVLPARRAAKIPPVAALRDDARLAPGSLRRRLLVGTALGVVGVALLASGLAGATGTPVLLVGGGILTVFLAVTTLSPFISNPVVRLLALPLPRLFKTPGRLSRENAVRNPRRTSATAAALMIGLALVSTFSVMGSSLKASFDVSIRQSLGADYVLSTEDYLPLSTDLAAQVADVPGVAQVGSVRFGAARFGEGEGNDYLTAVQPSAIGTLLTVDMVAGDAGALADDQLLVSAAIADREGWSVGQAIPAEFAASGTSDIVVGGTYEVNPLAGDYLISTALYDRSFSDHLDAAVMLKLADGADRAQVVASVERALEAFPNVRVLDQQEFSADQQGFIDTILALVSALLALAILIAMFGIVNTLALSVFERTHEIGLLRAVGMSRRQLRRMIRLESVLISTFGAVLGLSLGVGFGWAIVRSLRDVGVTELRVPFGTLAVYVVLAAVVGVIAALWPARRAARMDVLGAIATT